jgi:DNA polymerase-3 subunit alpha
VAKHPELFRDANDLIGVIRQTGVHAAAVLITPKDKPLRDVLPTRIKNGTLTTQFDMYDVEDLGGLKGDFLALRHLDALQIAADAIKERHGVVLDYENFSEIHYEDPAIWAQIDEG